MRYVLITLVAAVIAVFNGCSSGMGYCTENPDEFCKDLLTKPGTREVMPWLKEGPNTLGELPSNEDSVALAQEIYDAGAESVIGVEIDKDPSGENTGKLVIKLPKESALRNRVLNWAAGIAHSQGFEAYTDVGQDYVFVMLD